MKLLSRVLHIVLIILLIVLGLALALACLGRFAALSGVGPLWLDAAASAEAALGGMLLGAAYIDGDFFARGVVLALLSSLCFGLAAWFWPRRQVMPSYDINFEHEQEVGAEEELAH